MPPELRFSLGAFFLIVGVVAIYQRLRPTDVGGKDAIEEAEPPSTHFVLWVVSLAYLTAAAVFTITLPGKAALLAVNLAQWATSLAAVKVGLLTEMPVGELAGPLPPAVSLWTWVLTLFPLVFAAALYGIVRLQGAGRYRAVLATAGVSVAAVLVLTPFTLAALRVVTGDAYREELAVWLDTVTPARPDASLWGKEGPVVMQGFADQYLEIEPDILYRRWTRISETGEARQTETIYPFRMGPFTVDVGEGKDYRVAGIQSIDRVIIVNERLKVAGYLSGGVLEPRPRMPIVIMPSSLLEWRDTLRSAWVKPPLGSRVLVLVAVTYDVYIASALVALLILFIVQVAQKSVKTSGRKNNNGRNNRRRNTGGEESNSGEG